MRPARALAGVGAAGRTRARAALRALVRWCGLASGARPIGCCVFWFLHIPKTGGTSVRDVLQRGARRHGWTFVPLFRDHYRRFADHPDARRHPRSARPATREREATLRLNSTPWRRVWSELAAPRPRLIVESHTGSLGLGSYLHGVLANVSCALRAKGCGLNAVTVLREPVARALSLAADHAVPRARLASFFRDNRDGQLRYVWNGDQVDARVDERAVRRLLARFALVGRTEALDEFGGAVRKLLGWSDEELPLRHRNAGNASALAALAAWRALARNQTEGDRRLYGSFFNCKREARGDFCAARTPYVLTSPPPLRAPNDR